MQGPNLANVGKNNHVLEKKKEEKKLSNFLLNLIFQNPIIVKSKNENHQYSMCDSSKEPYGFTDYESEEKTKKKLIFD